MQLHHNDHFISVDFYAPYRIIEKRFNLALTMLENSNARGNGKKQDITRIPKFPGEYHYTEEAVNARLEWAREVSGAKLENVPHRIFKPETLAGNIENYIGAVQIPVGLAGPILVKGIYNNGYVPVPIATTEGALVSSIARGAKACNLAGGIHAYVHRQKLILALTRYNAIRYPNLISSTILDIYTNYANNLEDVVKKSNSSFPGQFLSR